MKTRMLGYEQASSITEIVVWGNGLIGKEAPGVPGYIVVGFVQFQIIPHQNAFDALVLAEVDDTPHDTEGLMLRAQDVEVIEELTSAVGEEPSDKSALPEL